jgi:hypothetical protein
MSITQAQQSEKAYKKSGLNVAMTGTGGAAFFIEPVSPFVVYANKIIGRPDLIPATAPTTNLVSTNRNNRTRQTARQDTKMEHVGEH